MHRNDWHRSDWQCRAGGIHRVCYPTLKAVSVFSGISMIEVPQRLVTNDAAETDSNGDFMERNSYQQNLREPCSRVHLRDSYDNRLPNDHEAQSISSGGVHGTPKFLFPSDVQDRKRSILHSRT